MLGTAAGMMIEKIFLWRLAAAKLPAWAWSLSSDQHDRFYELLKELDLGLEDRMTAKVGLLSGGQRQALTLFDGNAEKTQAAAFWTSIRQRWTPKLRRRCWHLRKKS